MSANRLKKPFKEKPIKVHFLQLTDPDRRLYFALHRGEVFVPAVIAAIAQDVAHPLAERAEGVRHITLASGINLYPIQWLAAVKPDRADDLNKLQEVLIKKATERDNLGPNQ